MQKTSSSVHFQKPRVVAAGKESETVWVPNTDVYVTDSGMVIKVEIAGIRREDLELTIDENRLKISGQRPDGCRTKKCEFKVMEINYGSFQTVVDVPFEYDISNAKAAYLNGFLRVDVPLFGGDLHLNHNTED